MQSPETAPQLQFPCNYTLKIIGAADLAFDLAVLPVLHHHIPNLTEGALTYKKSRNDKYMALSVNFLAHSRQQLDALYLALTNIPQVLMAL